MQSVNYYQMISNQIIILGVSSSLGKYLKNELTNSIGYCRSENGDLNDWLKNTNYPKKSIVINLIVSKNCSQENKEITRSIVDYCLKNDFKLIHISSLIVYSKDENISSEIKTNKEIESSYAQFKIDQEEIIINNYNNYSILRSGYLCRNIDSINLSNFSLYSISKKPKNSVLYYCEFNDLKQNLFLNKNIIDSYTGIIKMKHLLKNVLFIPKWIYIMISFFVKSSSPKIKELINEK